MQPRNSMTPSRQANGVAVQKNQTNHTTLGFVCEALTVFYRGAVVMAAGLAVALAYLTLISAGVI